MELRFANRFSALNMHENEISGTVFWISVNDSRREQRGREAETQTC